jgi:hypothetical protein
MRAMTSDSFISDLDLSGGFHEEIKRRAYEVYLERLRTNTPGDHLSDWYQAENEVLFLDWPTRGVESFKSLLDEIISKNEQFQKIYYSSRGFVSTDDPNVYAYAVPHGLTPSQLYYSQPPLVYIPPVTYDRLIERELVRPGTYGSGFDFVDIAEIIMAIGAAGGVKVLVEALKLWVEERKDRMIKIKKGDVEIVLQGNVGKKEIDRAVRLFEQQFKEKKLILIDE